MKRNLLPCILSGMLCISFVGCANQQTSSTSSNSSQSSIDSTDEKESIAFDVQIKDSFWQVYHREFLNEDGNMNQDGREIDEVVETLSFTDTGVFWLKYDGETFETIDMLDGTFVEDKQMIIIEKIPNSESTVDSLQLEKMDHNILKLEYPENQFTYFEYVDLDSWSDDYITVEQLADTLWIATEKKECLNSCEITDLDNTEETETVQFYSNGRAHFQNFDWVNLQSNIEFNGFWYIEGTQIVLDNISNDDDVYSTLYFTYENGNLYRTHGGAIEYTYSFMQSLQVTNVNLPHTKWVIESQSIFGDANEDVITTNYPDQNNTLITMIFEDDDTVQMKCYNVETNEIYYDVHWDWYLNGSTLTVQLPEGDTNPYGLMSPRYFMVSDPYIYETTVSQDGSTMTTDTYVQSAG